MTNTAKGQSKQTYECTQTDSIYYKIELYVYCWIMTRVRADIVSRRRPSQGVRRAPQTHSLSDDEEDDSVIDDFAAASGPNEYLDRLMEDMESDQLQHYASPITNPGVPTAPMLSLRNNAAAVSEDSTVGTDDHKEIIANRSDDLIAPVSESIARDSDNEEASNLQTLPGRLKKIKRRDTSSGETLSAKKRRIAHAEESVPHLRARGYSTRQRAREEANDNADLYAYPSPPLVQHDTTVDEVVTRNFPNLPDPRRDDDYIETTMSGALPEGNVLASEQNIRSNSVCSVDDAIVVDVQRNITVGDAPDNTDYAPDSDQKLRCLCGRKLQRDLGPNHHLVA
jgi:hypothetical protein